MEGQSVHDVRPEQYPSVIRDLIRHEDDVTNQRLMWLLIIQGLLVNAYVIVRVDRRAANGVACTGILVTISAFLVLYKSYHARGYVNFLGSRAKLGRLQEKYLSLDGWPSHRIKSWRKARWLCPWLQSVGDLIEPFLFLPGMILAAYLFLLLRAVVNQSLFVVLGMAVVGSWFTLFALAALWVWSQKREDDEPESPPES